jgi:hypothetical protein
MAQKVFTVESDDRAIRLLQQAKVLPTTVLLDEVDFPATEEGEEPPSDAEYETALDEKYDALIEQAEADTSVAEVGPEREEEGASEEVPPEASVVSESAADYGSGPYEGRTLEQLRALAASRGLPTSGTKDEVIERLRA